MKKLLLTLCLFYGVNAAIGQSKMPYQTADSSNRNSWEAYKIKYNNPLYVIDNVVVPDASSKQVYGEVDPYTVTRIAIMWGKRNERNTVYITTDTKRISAYEKKLCTFCAEYKSYLEAHQNKDTKLSYVINGEPLQGFRKDIITKLYELPVDKITAVSLDITGVYKMVKISANL